ncbi:cytoplasmic tRNA 2-thiolation protein-like protein 2 [Xylogone sp. PMI_703]|nr:cytoplasmic tRNA 2-thiolation protein-like protein 2 [Xylogone sp. PMI_703]
MGDSINHISTEWQGILCKKCNEKQATHKIRSEQVCQACFSKYINTKTVKRLEAYGVRRISGHKPKQLLVPLSFGPSSSSLLHMLDQHLQGQEKNTRMKGTTYELHVVHIDIYLDEADRKNSSELLEKFKTRYPRHNYSSYGLEEALLVKSIDWGAFDLPQPHTIDSNRPLGAQLQEILNLMPSATSRVDIITTLLIRLLVDVAQRNKCESILLGDSTTRLAERTLTETAKGRGFSLPWQVSDGASPYGVGLYYPLRDLLKKELVTFTTITSPPLLDLVLKEDKSPEVSTSSKTTTIDDLMKQYFESVEENYPGIVANVVRTSSKLKSLPQDGATSCSLCGFPVAEGTDGIYGWGGDQNSSSRAPNNHSQGVLCYGCSRSING